MTEYKQLPAEEGIDHTLNLLREGYLFILNRRRSFQSDVFMTKLLGKETVCMGGREAAEVFYDTERFQRKGAAPKRAVQTLFGEGGVQSLDGKEHADRKAMFMSIMTPENLSSLGTLARASWDKQAEKWAHVKEVTFYNEMKEILCRTACNWAGVPVEDEEIGEIAKDLGAMFETPAAIGPKHWIGRMARNKREKWMEDIVKGVREGSIAPPEHTALNKFALHRDQDGHLLDSKVAAVEVLNIIRPITAVAVYLNFLLIALQQHQEEREKLADGDEQYIHMFIQEVRRFYPFFPFAAALVKRNFDWKGYKFKEGTLALLDLYGTNHDSDIWESPERFDPERFRNNDNNMYELIPQGGGDYFLGHRCAGEWATLELLKTGVDYLVNRLSYDVPDQDLSFTIVDMPSIPRTKVVIKKMGKTG